MGNIGKTFTILCLAFLASLASAQHESVGCFEKGECRESMISHYGDAFSPQECLDFCQSHDHCKHWTHYADSNFCITFSNCVEFSSAGCSDCISGDKGCDDLACFQNGYCDGVFIGFGQVASANDCLNLCRSVDSCVYWSFNTSDHICVMTKDCPIVVDDECPSCIYGHTACAEEIVTTTTTSTTSTTSTTTTMMTTVTTPTTSTTRTTTIMTTETTSTTYSTTITTTTTPRTTTWTTTTTTTPRTTTTSATTTTTYRNNLNNEILAKDNYKHRNGQSPEQNN